MRGELTQQEDYIMGEREQLEQAIAVLESQRTILGDAVVTPAIAGIRQQLGRLAQR